VSASGSVRRRTPGGIKARLKTLLSGDQELTLTVICAVAGLAAGASDRWAPGAGLRIPLFVVSYLAGGIGPGLDLIRNLLVYVRSRKILNPFEYSQGKPFEFSQGKQVQDDDI